MKLAPFFLRFILILSCSLASQAAAATCPTIAGLVDTNCDGKLILVGLGDSVVYGRIADKQRDPQKGYLGRIKHRIPEIRIPNLTPSGEGLGLPGDWTQQMLCRVKWQDQSDICRNSNQLLRTGNSLAKIQTADYVVIDIGRNDYFIGASPAKAVNQIQQTVMYLRQVIQRRKRVIPVMAVAKLIPSTRTVPITNRPTSQGVFVEQLNNELIKRRSVSVPSYLDFSQLSPSLISSDGLHPLPAGYISMTDNLEEYLRGRAQVQALSRQTK